MIPENPNECATCDHKADPDGGWCYMFRDEPTEVCMKHTSHLADLRQIYRLAVKLLIDDIAEGPKP